MTLIHKQLAVLFFSSIGWADVQIVGPPCQPNEPGRGGQVVEHSRFQNTNFIVHITDLNGKDLFQVPLNGINVPGDGSVAQYFQPPGMAGVCDARNETLLPAQGGGGGAGASLSLEAYLLDVNSNKFVMHDIWDTIATLGVLRIPDLYADADGNGVPDTGVVLYSLINLATFAPIPSFAFGDQFQIVNGKAPGLDMFFSTTRPVFDPATGFTGTPYTGTAIAETDHVFVPEPGSFFLSIGAIVLITAAKWKRRPA
jgi:hypothetical protein